MNTLYIDLESSDLLHRDLPLDHPSQPWAISIAAELVMDDGRSWFMHLPIRSEGRPIAAGAEAVHGVSTRQAASVGVNEIPVLGTLCGLAENASCVVGHGIPFDRDVVTSLLMRKGKNTRMWTMAGLEFVDTMTAAAPLCRLPGASDSGEFKWPSLDEACSILLGMEPREGPHSAWEDLQRTRRLHEHLVRERVLEIAA